LVTTLDSYSESNRDDYYHLNALHPSSTSSISATAQSFTTPATGTYTLATASWFLKKVGSPTGSAYAKIYAHSGTYGTSSVPTGAALATSDAFDISTLTTTFSLVSFTFSGANQITLSTNTHYVVVFGEVVSGTLDGSNEVQVGVDGSSPTHGGNCGQYSSSVWNYAAYDLPFYVYGNLVTSGWAHTFIGVAGANISTIEGVARASVSTVIGV